jgi:hypothetical protein
VFRAVLSSGDRNPSDPSAAVDFSGFCEALGRCALLAFAHSPDLSTSDKVSIVFLHRYRF